MLSATTIVAGNFTIGFNLLRGMSRCKYFTRLNTSLRCFYTYTLAGQPQVMLLLGGVCLSHFILAGAVVAYFWGCSSCEKGDDQAKG